jgi:dihydroorotate dehydrogenase
MSEKYHVGHLEVATPWGNAGGVLKSVEDVYKMSLTGVGWEEPGTYTLEYRPGNAQNGEVDYVHDPVTGMSNNSLGMPNKGMDVVEKEIPEMVEIAHARGKKLIINVGPVTTEPEEESLELVTRAYIAGADAVLLNGGCPNVITEDGSAKAPLSKDPVRLFQTLNALKPVVEKYPKIFLRVSPQDSLHQAYMISNAIAKSGVVSTVFTPNTWPGRLPEGSPQLEVPGGGISGPGTRMEARRQTAWMAMRGLFDVVSSGGIMDGHELKRRMFIGPAGVVKGGAGTTFFYEARRHWGPAVDRLLWEFTEDLKSE